MVVRVARSCPPFAHLLRRRAEDHGGGPLPRSLSPHVRPRGTGRTFRGPLLPRAGEPAPAVCRPCLPQGTQRWGGALRATAGQTEAAWAPECPRQSLHSGLSQTVPASRGLGEVTPGANRKPLLELRRPELAPAGCLVTRRPAPPPEGTAGGWRSPAGCCQCLGAPTSCVAGIRGSPPPLQFPGLAPLPHVADDQAEAGGEASCSSRRPPLACDPEDPSVFPRGVGSVHLGAQNPGVAGVRRRLWVWAGHGAWQVGGVSPRPWTLFFKPAAAMLPT